MFLRLCSHRFNASYLCRETSVYTFVYGEIISFLLFRILAALPDIDSVLLENFADSIAANSYDGSNLFWVFISAYSSMMRLTSSGFVAAWWDISTPLRFRVPLIVLRWQPKSAASLYTESPFWYLSQMVWISSLDRRFLVLGDGSYNFFFGIWVFRIVWVCGIVRGRFDLIDIFP